MARDNLWANGFKLQRMVKRGKAQNGLTSHYALFLKAVVTWASG
jgi:hypothetical protein